MRQITFSRYAVSGHLSHGGDAHAHAQLVLGGESSVPERPAGGRERAPRDCRAPGPAPAITTVKFMGQVPSARHDTPPVPTGFLHDLQDPVGLLNEGHLHVPFEEKAALGLGGVAPAGGPGGGGARRWPGHRGHVPRREANSRQSIASKYAIFHLHRLCMGARGRWGRHTPLTYEVWRVVGLRGWGGAAG